MNANLLLDIFLSFEAGIAAAISSFKLIKKNISYFENVLIES